MLLSPHQSTTGSQASIGRPLTETQTQHIWSSSPTFFLIISLSSAAQRPFDYYQRAVGPLAIAYNGVVLNMFNILELFKMLV